MVTSRSAPSRVSYLVLTGLLASCLGSSQPKGEALSADPSLAAMALSSAKDTSEGRANLPVSRPNDDAVRQEPAPDETVELSEATEGRATLPGSRRRISGGPRALPVSEDLEDGAETAPDREPVSIEIDREAHEVRFPCRFVNPARQIEVFACHRRGPTHETVVEFDATGEQLYRALLEIGCRPTDYWNVTSAGDFLRNQGDRVLVLVRWTWEGKTRELPAEAMLLDGETGFSSFIRGFSFSAYDVDTAVAAEESMAEDLPGDLEPPAGEEADEQPAGLADSGDSRSPRRRIPRAVEISLGATQRQRAIFSLLSHPTTLSGAPATRGGPPTRALQPWSLPPLVDDRILPELDRMVARQPEATLIFRRVSTEKELLQYARGLAAERGVEARLSLYEQLEPLAAEIDSLKSRYEELGAELRQLVATDFSVFYGDGRGDFLRRGELLRRRGQSLCHRIQELYFTIYQKQQRFRLNQLSLRPDIHPEVLAMVKTFLESGLDYEVRIAKLESASHELRLRDNLLSLRTWALELERSEGMILAQQEDIRGRIRELGEDETYVRQLLEEDLARWQTAFDAVQDRQLLCAAFLDENAALLDETDSPVEGYRPALRAPRDLLRRMARAGLRAAKLEESLLEVEESMRWARDDLESDIEERREKAGEQLETLEKRKEELEGRLAEVRRLRQELKDGRARESTGRF